MGKHHTFRADVLHAVRQEDADKLEVLFDSRRTPLPTHHPVLTDAFHEACIHGKLDHARYLLDINVSPNCRESRHRRTPMMRATSVAVVEFLRHAHADINARDRDGKTALMLSRHYDVSKYLVEQTKADVTLCDNEGHTALVNVLLDCRRDLRDASKRIAILLIDNAEVDINAADPQGRTVLMTAVWRNEPDVVRHLLEDPRIHINKPDVRGRNVLHHLCEDAVRAERYRNNCADQDDEDIANLLLASDINLNKREDIVGRTPLHCALISRNQVLAIKLLDSKRPLDLTLLDSRKWSALHFAASVGMHELVTRLLKTATVADVETADGQTPFQLAARFRGDAVKTLEQLRPGSDIFRKTGHSKTALHLAAEIGNLATTEYLLKYFVDPIVNAKDDFGDSALLCAARSGHTAIVHLLLPLLPLSTSSATVSSEESKAAAGTTATVVDFVGVNIKVTSRRVHDLVYDRSYSSPTVSLKAELQRSTGEDAITVDDDEQDIARFRWVHLPANDVTWCKRLFLKLLLEEDSKVHFETFKALEQSFDHQQRGKHLHACYMRPTCHHNPSVSRKKAPIDDEEHAIYDDDVEDTSDAGTHSQGGQGTHQSSRRHSHVRAKSLGATHDSLQDRKVIDEQISGLREELWVPDNVYLFMPYLHYETLGNRDLMLRAVCKAHDKDPGQGLPRSHRHHPRICSNMSTISGSALLGTKKRVSSGGKQHQSAPEPTADENLIYAHAMPSLATLQIRRTLDQFFYRTIDTSQRDIDQVIYREQKRQAWDDVEFDTTAKLSAPEARSKVRDIHRNANIIMVDQLWLWIVRDDLIVTSFPRGWNKDHDNDEHGVWQAICNDLQRPGRQPVLGVHELATIITGHCYGWVDRRDASDSNLLFMNMFESSLGYAMEEEVRLFRAFQKASEKASVWLKEIRGHPVEPLRQTMYERYAMSVPDLDDEAEEDDTGQQNKASNAEPAFVQTLLDIGAETRLLREVKDIRDELDMLKMIYETQETHVPEMFDHLVGLLPERDEQRKRIEELHQDQVRHITYPLRDIKRMTTQAERIYNSIRDLLDLKQKHANAMQATDTARQGKTLMVFTIVTVIFLPLSFLAAFFAINVTQFPHQGKDGGLQMSLSYVSSYVFGIGSAIALLCVIFAWSAEKLDILRIHMQRSTRLWWRGLWATTAKPPTAKTPPPASAPLVPTVAPAPPSSQTSNDRDLENQKTASSPPKDSEITRWRGSRHHSKS
ncbi:hypothetical protein LTR78_003693 [Recurvomyces mirabilis]|uniref:Ankyrin repeat protein n=1 Tax=Recurvomyces mirabilis TaxID=574656 RepID=A0AAE0WR93_9PEZI|nr:hypothetical protein LTR78_003693 [Recurvomyces mirabilis]KAK5154805.1 hypothetical protein LTS14_006386 [Recurvomyces mirabilis]